MITRLFTLFSLLLIVASFQSCVKDKCEREVTYTKATPVYLTWDEIRADIQSESPRAMEKPGKLYFYNDYIFINEQREGVHIIDNSNPEAPFEMSFIPILGNVDIAIRGDILYADNYTDLLTIDISDINQVRLVKRLEDVFPNFGTAEEGVITHYTYEEVTETFDCNDNLAKSNGDLVFVDASFPAQESFNSGIPSGASIDFDFNVLGQTVVADGTGGSFARFTLYDNFLYTVGLADMNVFDISQVDCPIEVNEINIGWNIETIYPFQDHLFIGSMTGMFIYDLVEPGNPTFVSQYFHWTGCDPVFVKDNFAYVTIHSGTNCNGGQINELQLVDITDIRNPFNQRSFTMQNPHGLSIRDNDLYLCEAEFGLKIFDIENPLTLAQNQLVHLDDFDAYDVISVPGERKILLLIGSDGFYQFDVEDPRNPKELSHLPVAVR